MAWKEPSRMRMIGRIPRQEMARRFGAWLGSRGISGQVEQSRQGDWMFWVEDEERVPEAVQALERFLSDPEAEEFRIVGKPKAFEPSGREASPSPVAPSRHAAGQVIDMRTQWHRDASALSPLHYPVTMALILISVGVFVASLTGKEDAMLRPLGIVAPLHYPPWLRERPWIMLRLTLQKGQAWRLITPIFLHFGVLHILFNMTWMWDLGRMIESKRGAFYFALLVVAIAIPSNVLQLVASGPGFGGMSGVVFGLIGYIWIRNRFSYRAEYPLHPQAITMSLVWLVVCMLGIMGMPIANWAHGGGLVVGMTWGYLASDRFRRLFAKR